MAEAGSHPVLLYDGLCPVCNRVNLFVLQHDTIGVFRFAPLQSSYAQAVLKRHGGLPLDLDTIYVVVEPGTPGEHLLQRGVAISYLLRGLGGRWRWLGGLLDVLPSPLVRLGYNFIARNRYRWTGRYEQCALPRPEWRERFIEIVE